MIKKISGKKVFESKWINVYFDQILDKHGSTQMYNVVDFKNESVVVMVENDEQLLVTENYRYPINSIQLEFPAGNVESNETPEQAAVREVLEETGITIKCKKISYSFYPSNGITNQKIHVVIAQYVKGFPKADDEILNCYWIKKSDFEYKICKGDITDGPTLIAYLYGNIVKVNSCAFH